MPTARVSGALAVWLFAFGLVGCGSAASSVFEQQTGGAPTAGSSGTGSQAPIAENGGALPSAAGNGGSVSGAAGAAGTAGSEGAMVQGGADGAGGASGASGAPGAAGASSTAGAAGASGTVTTFSIAYSCDGNQHDHDDFHASPMSLALIAEKGLKGALVHFDYNNHLGDNDASMAATHAQNIQAARDAYAYDSAPFFDDQRALLQSVEHLAKAIEAATPARRLYLVCAGPMEVCWRAINAANAANRRNTTAISHSGWNDDHADTPQLRHRWTDIQSTGVVYQHLNDQNTPAFKSSCSDWAWLKDAAHPRPWLYDRVCSGDAAGDASDAGMTYYVLSGVKAGATATSSPDMAAIKAVFGE